MPEKVRQCEALDQLESARDRMALSSLSIAVTCDREYCYLSVLHSCLTCQDLVEVRLDDESCAALLPILQLVVKDQGSRRGERDRRPKLERGGDREMHSALASVLVCVLCIYRSNFPGCLVKARARAKARVISRT